LNADRDRCRSRRHTYSPPPAPYIKKFAADTTMTAYAYVSLYTVLYSVLLFYVYVISSVISVIVFPFQFHSCDFSVTVTVIVFQFLFLFQLVILHKICISV